MTPDPTVWGLQVPIVSPGLSSQQVFLWHAQIPDSALQLHSFSQERREGGSLVTGHARVLYRAPICASWFCEGPIPLTGSQTRELEG